MSVTSFTFIVFFLFSLALYYILPKAFQWKLLLLFSAVFFAFSENPITAVYLLVSIFATYISANLIKKYKNTAADRKLKLSLLFGIIVNVAILAILKYSNFFISNINLLFGVFRISLQLSKVSIAAPIGISFYSLQAVGYLLDSYWGMEEPQPSIAKTALFVGYYPLLTSGPIVRYGEVKDQLFSKHSFDFDQIRMGLLRMLWGFFKKLVISARLGVLVDTIYGAPQTYNGFYIWIAATLFMFQLYTDFSGCMDIILGASECYGIVLPENFRTPFFSHSVQEYWQRWHITLGGWLKNYILYPILRTKLWKNLTKSTKKRFGKKAAKQLPSYLGMLCVWLLIGLWHGGGWKYIIGMGIWFFMCIMLSQVMKPVFEKITAFLHINTDTFSYRLFQSIRVFFLVSIGNMFFRLDGITATLQTLRQGVSAWNPEIFFNGDLYTLGLSEKNVRLAICGLIVLLVVSILQEKKSIRKRLSEQNIAFQILVAVVLLFSVVIFGMYGPGYETQSFIYEAF